MGGGSRAFPEYKILCKPSAEISLDASIHFRAKSLLYRAYLTSATIQVLRNRTVQLTFPYRGFSVYTRLFVTRAMQKEREG